MAFLEELAVPFTSLIVATIRPLGQALDGKTVGVTMRGNGTTSGDSDYQVYQSNDNSNWFLIAGVVITNLSDVAQEITIQDLFTMKFLGWSPTSKGTETTGTIDIRITTK